MNEWTSTTGWMTSLVSTMPRDVRRRRRPTPKPPVIVPRLSDLTKVWEMHVEQRLPAPPTHPSVWVAAL